MVNYYTLLFYAMIQKLTYTNPSVVMTQMCAHGQRHIYRSQYNYRYLVVKNKEHFQSLPKLYKARTQSTVTFHNHLCTFLHNNCSHRQCAISYFKSYRYMQDNFYINFRVNQSNLIRSSSFFGTWCTTSGSIWKTFP